MSEEIDQRRQRSKNGRGWAVWLRNPRLLRWAIKGGIAAYRLWRWWEGLFDSTDG